MSRPDNQLASQAQLTQLANRMGGRIPVRVFFLNNSSKVFLAKEGTRVKELVRMVVDKLELKDPDDVAGYFALYESLNGSSIGDACHMDALIADVINRWGTNKAAKLVFMIRIFVKSVTGLETVELCARRLGKDVRAFLHEDYLSRAHTYDNNCLVLQHMQAVYNVITGKYPVSEEDAIRLGAIHFLFKFKEYNPEQHVIGFLGNRIVEFIPTLMLRAKRKDMWERLLYEELEAVMIPSGKDAMRVYVEEVLRLEHLYGCEFYFCRQLSLKNLPPDVYLGINSYGVTLFNKKKEMLRKYRLEGIFRWGYQPNSTFYFEIKSSEDAGSILEFETNDGEKMSKLLTDYALAFLQERDRDRIRAMTSVEGANELMDSCVPDEDMFHAESLQSGETSNMVTAAEAASNLEEVKEYDDIADSAFVFNRGNGNQKKGLSQHAAATQIQALYRGYALRAMLIRHEAAIMIQAVFRGHLVRQILSEVEY